MINIIRHQDFFDPIKVKKEVHVIGVGAVGSFVASFLARLGVEKIHIWDFDIVEEHNIPNQNYYVIDYTLEKTNATSIVLKEINPELKVIIHKEYKDEILEGYVFVCVDNIEVRKEIYLRNEFNINIEYIFDTRIGLDTGQVFSAKWNKQEHIEFLLDQSQFKKDEADVPKSACGTKLTVLPSSHFN